MNVAKRIKDQKKKFITSFDVNEICCYFHESDMIWINSDVQNEINFCFVFENHEDWYDIHEQVDFE